MGYGLWVMGYGLRVMGYGLWVTGFLMEQRFQIIYFVHRFVGFDDAVVDDDDTVAHLLDLLQDMRRENDGAVLSFLPYQGAYLFQLVRVEAGGGFVEYQQLRVR